jgi:hypothetical protein
MPAYLRESPATTLNVLIFLSDEPLCAASRGGLYNPALSSDWRPLGAWQLGLEHIGLGGNGDYGTDTVASWDPNTNLAFSMNSVLMAALNTTGYYLGFFGLGITQGTFGDQVGESPLTQAVKSFGWIPSYSYGYTAGAHYGKS